MNLIDREQALEALRRMVELPNEMRVQAMAAVSRVKAAYFKPQWIPVTEELPPLIPCAAGTAYSEAINVLTSGRKVLTAIWDGSEFITDAEFWEAEGEEITHWAPVILPLPQPPKGD